MDPARGRRPRRHPDRRAGPAHQPQQPAGRLLRRGQPLLRAVRRRDRRLRSRQRDPLHQRRSPALAPRARGRRPPPLFCRRDDPNCKLNGGAATQRTDITIAVAWNILASLRIGIGIHLPRLRQRFSYDNSTVLSEHRDDGPRCNRVENPLCAERVGFNGRTRWLPDRDNRPAGFDVALTFGLAVDVSDRVTLGLRYRTRPLVRGGDLTLAGDALVCRPDTTEGTDSDVLPCSVASPIDATLTERVSREAAIGAAFVLDRGRFWHIDTNLYWIDLCNDVVGRGAGVRSCADPAASR
ncbi:hypothetical protein OV079_10935 [Nannocystis pusilla]|uniref:Uncharacterized protein n=1 Tax=Nannocystis pusilla TaxID=889268 RepID=A0A9X3ET58_9BACT|nr:hypothetical protein [Nannocystis pusilla]MCY1006066.1 hypothetical protein [Nannocystis pusilla]